VSRSYDIKLFSRNVAMPVEHCSSRSESKTYGMIAALLLVACGIFDALIFLAFRPLVTIFTMNAF
jgi:hypothetical protein